MDPKSKVAKSNPLCLPNFKPNYYNGVKNIKRISTVPAGGGEYPRYFEAAIPQKEDSSAKTIF